MSNTVCEYWSRKSGKKVFCTFGFKYGISDVMYIVWGVSSVLWSSNEMCNSMS